uniref:Uncharacterized protein n=1 Tax=candidate division WOR-3 bacterium TaxID=2052148 RepID=A0A7C6A9C9_UNCW3
MKKLILPLLYFITIISLTCKPTTLYFGKPSIIGQVSRYPPYGESERKTRAYVSISNSRLLPVVCINNK